MPFSISDREILRAVKGVGPTVITRLEQLGYSDMVQLAGADVQDIVERTAALVGSSCWKNSPQAKQAIQAAIGAATRACKKVAESELVQMPLAPDHAISEFESKKNLGLKSAAILTAAGIHSMEQLTMLGSVAAFTMAKRTGARVSLNLLWALEGAITGE